MLIMIRMSKKLIYLFIIAILLVLSIGYYLNTKSLGYIKENAQGAVPPQITHTISIGTISDDAVKEVKLFQPTADYLADKLSDNETKYKGKVIIVETIDNITDLLKEQKLDLYVDSPFTTALVTKKSGAVPFLRRWKQGAVQYHTLFFVRADSLINRSDDFIGKTIASEDPASTSAYLLPKAYLIQKGFNVNQSSREGYIKFIFSGVDENTPLWVIERKADIGVINNKDFEELPESIKDKVRVVERTIDVPRHVVSYRSGLDPVSVERIKQIFLNMDTDAQGIEVLKEFQNTTKYDELPEDVMFNISKMVNLLE